MELTSGSQSRHLFQKLGGPTSLMVQDCDARLLFVSKLAGLWHTMALLLVVLGLISKSSGLGWSNVCWEERKLWQTEATEVIVESVIQTMPMIDSTRLLCSLLDLDMRLWMAAWSFGIAWSRCSAILEISTILFFAPSLSLNKSKSKTDSLHFRSLNIWIPFWLGSRWAMTNSQSCSPQYNSVFLYDYSQRILGFLISSSISSCSVVVTLFVIILLYHALYTWWWWQRPYVGASSRTCRLAWCFCDQFFFNTSSFFG